MLGNVISSFIDQVTKINIKKTIKLNNAYR